MFRQVRKVVKTYRGESIMRVGRPEFRVVPVESGYFHLMAGVALAVRHELDIRILAGVLSVTHDTFGGARIGGEFGVVPEPRVSAEQVAVEALFGHIFFAEGREEPVAGVLVMCLVAGYAASDRSKVRVFVCQIPGINDRIARFAANCQSKSDYRHH